MTKHDMTFPDTSEPPPLSPWTERSDDPGSRVDWEDRSGRLWAPDQGSGRHGVARGTSQESHDGT